MDYSTAAPSTTQEFLRVAIHSGITIYMALVLLYWAAPFLSLDMSHRPYRWIPPLTDPLLNFVRRTLPPMGFTDWAPLATVLLLWVVRVLLTRE